MRIAGKAEVERQMTMATSIAWLDLVALPIADREFGDDPEAWFEQARAGHPFLAKFADGYGSCHADLTNQAPSFTFHYDT